MTDGPIPIADFKKQKQERERAQAEAEPRPREFTDESLAMAFADRHADDLRYVATWGKWLHWTGTKWALDETLLAFDRARSICREAASRCHNDRHLSSNISRATTVAAVERLARSDRRLAATSDQWDLNPMLLNTPKGVIDLRNGSLRVHDPADCLTKITSVSPGGGCPTWHSFLDRITAGDNDLQNFLQRVVGYGLTGDTSAHALFFLFGTGANGKSVFIDTISRIMAEYHKTAPIETFTASSGDKHPTDLAGLRGARLVTSVETEEGRRWAESRIKQLTGGDTIAARFMRQDFFEFTPMFKLLIAGNHRPGLRSVDEAIRRRFHLVPFTVTIPLTERDEKLKEKLKAEWSGILAWAIQGAMDWQECGLAPPPAVLQATAAYLEAEDATAAWIEACCTSDPNGWETSTALFSSWREWATKAGEYEGSAKSFAAKLEARGFRSHRKPNGRGYYGFRLNTLDFAGDSADRRDR